MTRLGVITGLAREADCFGNVRDQDTLWIRCVGGDSKRAAETARILASEGCGALVSFGIAGGLEPSLNPGTVVIAASVVGEGSSRFQCDPTWRRRLIVVLGSQVSVIESDVFGSDQPVLLSRQKRHLNETTGAGAVDMESLAIARVAAEQEIPFLTVRAIADPSSLDLPSWVPGLVGPDGRPRLWPVIRGVVAHPFQVPILFRLSSDSEKAFASLRRVALAAGPFLQFSA